MASRWIITLFLVIAACGMDSAAPAIDAPVDGCIPAPAVDAARPPVQPTVIAIAIPPDLAVGGPATFAAQIADPDGLVTTVTWTFGDGESATDEQPARAGGDLTSSVTHGFAASGVYGVAVRGAAASRSAKVAVARPGSACTVHNFTVTAPDFYYAFAGTSGQNPDVTVCLGESFVFHLDDVSFMHPFCIWHQGAPIEAAGVSPNCQSGTVDMVWTVPYDVPEGAQYLCEKHYFGNVFTIH